MKKTVSIILSVAVICLMSNCSEKAIVKNSYPSGHPKDIFEAKSSASSAPGQIKKQAGYQSAKPFAPGQVAKQKDIQAAKQSK